MKTIAASDFKTRCLSLLDEVARDGETLLILKRGRPVARVLPISDAAPYPQHTLRGTVQILGDIVSSPIPEDTWLENLAAGLGRDK